MLQKDQRVMAHPGTDAWMQGDRYGTVQKVGRKWIHVKMDNSGKIRKLPPDRLYTPDIQEISVRKAPEPPASAVGKKCWYITPSGRKVACVIDSLDRVTHPTRFNLRVTAIKDPTYIKGKLINTPPAFVQPR